jgi:hypothetical protein
MKELGKPWPPVKERIALIDTGVLRDHPLLKPHIVDSKDFTGEGPEDRNGHGTTIAILLVADSEIARSSPPMYEILNVKAFREDGTGTYAQLVAGLEWAIKEQVKLINVSAGTFLPCISERIGENVAAQRSCERLKLCQLVMKATTVGILVNAVVGNTPGKIACPACCKHSLAVGNRTSNTGADVIVPT